MKSLHIPRTIHPELKKLASKKALRWTLPIASITILVAVVVILQAVVFKDSTNPVVDAESYKEELQGQVSNSDGSPRDGRDPASQRQNSLASAANKPTGSSGRRTSSPASGVIGSHDHQANSSDVYGNPEETGIGANGCFIDYGTPGEQCLPAHAATNGTLTCEGVTTHGGFRNGIEVTGKDRFHLDKNHNGIACDSGDFS